MIKQKTPWNSGEAAVLYGFPINSTIPGRTVPTMKLFSGCPSPEFSHEDKLLCLIHCIKGYARLSGKNTTKCVLPSASPAGYFCFDRFMYGSLLKGSIPGT
jgi:hypothetical protein